MSRDRSSTPRRATRPLAGALGALGALVLALSLAPGAGARERGPSFTVRPAGDQGGVRDYFVLDTKPGRTLRGSVVVSNAGDRSGRVNLYPTDATTGQTTGAVYRSRQSPRRDVGAWVTLERGALRVDPGESAEVGFRLKVPRQGVRPGEHLGGIVAENATLKRARKVKRRNGRFQINIRTLTVVAVQADLPGRKRVTMTIGPVKAGGYPGGQQAVFVTLANTGTKMLKPTLTTTIRKPDGRLVQRRRQELDTFVPASQIAFPVLVRRKALPGGDYRAEMLLTDGDRVLARASRDFEVTNKQLRQTFGDRSPLVQDSERSWTRIVPWIIAGAMAVLFAVTQLRRRRLGGRTGE